MRLASSKCAGTQLHVHAYRAAGYAPDLRQVRSSCLRIAEGFARRKWATTGPLPPYRTRRRRLVKESVT